MGTVIFYTSDNGPHQGQERSDIHYSSNHLRQCKSSMFEGGIRVPGLMHYPGAIERNVNVTTPAISSDFLPTIMSILQVETDNPTWTMDGLDLLPIVRQRIASDEYVSRPKPLGFWTAGQQAVIDNNWKILHNPTMGQCDAQ